MALTTRRLQGRIVSSNGGRAIVGGKIVAEAVDGDGAVLRRITDTATGDMYEAKAVETFSPTSFVDRDDDGNVDPAELGGWKIDLIPTDSADADPTGFGWRVTVYAGGSERVLAGPVTIAVPTGDGTPLELGLVAPHTPVPEFAVLQTYTQAAAARDEAVTAKEEAEAAAASVQRGAPNGTAPLDGAGKLPEGNVPARLSEAGLSAAIATQIEATGVGVENVTRATVAGGETYTIDPAVAGKFILTLTGNATLAFGSGLVDGQAFTVRIVQDPTGGRTLTLPDAIGPVPPVDLDTTPNTFETLVYEYDGYYGRLIVHQMASGPYEPPWSPAAMTGQIAWFEAEDIAGDEGSPIDAWPNRFPERGLVPRLTNHRPTLQFDGGIPVVRFDGTDDRMYVGTVAGTVQGWQSGPYAQAYTIAFNAKVSSLAAKQQMIIGNHSTISASGPQIYADSSASGSKWKSNAGTIVDSAVVDNLAWTTVVATFDGASSKIRVNGVEVTGSAGAAAFSTMQLGTNTGSSAYAGADIAEVVAVSHAVTGTELTNLETYLNAKRTALAA